MRFRQTWFWAIFFCLWTGIFSSFAVAQVAGQKPNVVFILADDLGWVDTQLYGSKYYRTPNIDALAKRGMRFSNCYTANPLCSPTRASILTGLYPGRIGMTTPNGHLPVVKLKATIEPLGPLSNPSLQAVSATRLDTSYYTLGEAFHDAGYATGHFGKWHLGSDPYSPLQQGFDVDIPHHPGPGPAGSYQAPWKFAPKLNFIGKPGENLEDRMAEEAEKWLRANKDKPFFLNYWAFSVHAPFDGRPDYIEQFKKTVDENDPQKTPIYAAMVKSLDDAVGHLVKTLDDLNLSQNTLIVFTSDNGGNIYDRVNGNPPTSNAPLRGGKATQYEGGTHVPQIVIWPGKIKPDSQTEAFFSSVDWFPTLKTICNLKTPDIAFDGINQVPAFLGQGTPRDTLFCYFPHYTPVTGAVPFTWVRRGDWKLIRFFNAGPGQKDAFELYNIQDDISETKNLAPEKPELVQELNALILMYLKETGALIPGPNPAFDPTAKPPSPQPEDGAPKNAARKGPKTKKALTMQKFGEWTLSKDAKLAWNEGALQLISSGGDPYFFTDNLPEPSAGPYMVQLRMKSNLQDVGQVFWATRTVKSFGPTQRLDFAAIHDNQWHDYEIKFASPQPLTRLRLDPGNGAGEVSFAWIRLRDGAGKIIKEWKAPR